MVISILLILYSIATPIYKTSILRARETVLKDDLFQLRSLISQYTLDKQKAPQSLEDLIAAAAELRLAQQTYDRIKLLYAKTVVPGKNLQSAEHDLEVAKATSSEGTPYSSW